MNDVCTVFTAADFRDSIDALRIARIANAILAERGVRVYGAVSSSIPRESCVWDTNQCDEDNHTALLIAVQPIERKDTAETLVRELLKAGAFVPTPLPHDWVERARKVLEAKE